MIKRWISIGLITNRCNLDCSYCYIKHHDFAHSSMEKYSRPIEYMIEALDSRRLGGTCMFNLCADGETLLTPNIVEIIKGLLSKGHYVSVVTNGTTTYAIKEIAAFPKGYCDRLVFKCSLHYIELKKRRLLDLFAENIRLLEKSGISLSVECVACDELVEYVDEIKEYCRIHFGALPHIMTGRSEYIQGKYIRFGSVLSDDEYYALWSQFGSDLFEYQFRDFEKNCSQYFCHAGEYTCLLNLNTGDYFPCPGNSAVIGNIYADMDDAICFTPMATSCPLDSCFMGHVFNCLGGDYIDEYDPGYRYIQFRDRKKIDGSNWLTPNIRSVYSSTCNTQHISLDEIEKAYLKKLVGIKYGKNIIVNEEEISKRINTVLTEKHINRIAIYGVGKIGKWLYDIIKQTNLSIECGIDINPKEGVIDIPVVGIGSEIGEVDCIIVSVYYIFSHVKASLEKVYGNVRCISSSLLLKG